jgi:23S rRNA (adenine2503-C2)-methyltransferase
MEPRQSHIGRAKRFLGQACVRASVRAAVVKWRLNSTLNMASEESMATVNVLGLPAAELRQFVEALGEPGYRGAQIYHALYAERKFDFAEMSNLPAALREKLARQAAIALPRIVRRHLSSDGTVRYVLALDSQTGCDPASGRAPKQASIETVFMPEENRQTICVSTQAGCAVDCQFCLTATLGLVRNLTAGEIVGEVLVALEDNRVALKPQTNIVLMGQGEPMLNYDAVIAALRILLDQKGVAIAPRHAALSTSGIVPGIERLAQEKLRPNLAVSLNASSNEQRDQIMPINRKYPLEKLLEACRKFPLKPREWLLFEYVLLGGFNDSPEDARRVVRLLSGIRAKVNLIPWNPGALPFHRPDQARVAEFQKILVDKGVLAFVRDSRGQDVMAACGQLALSESALTAAQIAGAEQHA